MDNNNKIEEIVPKVESFKEAQYKKAAKEFVFIFRNEGEAAAVKYARLHILDYVL